MKKTTLLLTITAALLCGCASVGNNFDSRKLSEVKKGETTEPQLVALFGQPAQRGINEDGVVKLTWIYTELTTKGATFIPVVGMFAGGADTKTKTLIVRLDSAGKVAGYDYSGGGFSATEGTQNDPESSTDRAASCASPKNSNGSPRSQ